MRVCYKFVNGVQLLKPVIRSRYVWFVLSMSPYSIDSHLPRTYAFP